MEVRRLRRFAQLGFCACGAFILMELRRCAPQRRRSPDVHPSPTTRDCFRYSPTPSSSRSTSIRSRRRFRVRVSLRWNGKRRDRVEHQSWLDASVHSAAASALSWAISAAERARCRVAARRADGEHSAALRTERPRARPGCSSKVDDHSGPSDLGATPACSVEPETRTFAQDVAL